jgi:hypothetical protein
MDVLHLGRFRCHKDLEVLLGAVGLSLTREPPGLLPSCYVDYVYQSCPAFLFTVVTGL